MTLKMSFCLKAATELEAEDLESITGLIESYTRAGMAVPLAEEAAVRDLLAQVASERDENIGLLAMQHPDVFKAPAKPKIQPSANKVFTEDAAAAARALLKKKLGQLNSGLDPEVVQAGITLAGYHIEKGARTFAAFTKAMLEDLGEVVRPYLKSWYAATYFDPRAAAMQADMTPLDRLDQPEAPAAPKETPDVSDTPARVARDSADAGDGDGAVGSVVPGRGLGEGPQTSGIRTGSARRGRPDDQGVPAGGTAPLREPGNQQVDRADRAAEPSLFDDGTVDGERSDDPGIPGVQPAAAPSVGLAEAARARTTDAEKRAAQRAAESVEQKPGIESIRATLPYLLPEQQDDVAKAEARHAKEDGYGVLFTNGTGTGKTFTGLGVVKRFERAGKTEQLIVVPDAKIMADWVDSAKALGLTVTPLKDTKDAGKGVTITTYANLGENDALAKRSWDHVLADEAHMLMQSEDAKQTKALDALRALTMHPRGADDRFAMLNRPDMDEQQRLSSLMTKLRKEQGMATPEDRATIAARLTKIEDELKPLSRRIEAARDKMRAEVAAAQGAARTRATFLSATPFAYEKTVDWADGYLFDYGEGSQEGASYNRGDARDQFFMQHFGYRMRYNKLTEPDSKVDRGLLQRQFNGWLKKAGALSGRMLNVEADYDRRFVLVDSAVGNAIDRAIEWVREKDRETSAANGSDNTKPNGAKLLNAELSQALFGPTGHLTRRYLLEAIKAKEVVQHVKEHMALGRKVVVFHDFKKGGATNPFSFEPMTAMKGDMQTAEEFASMKAAFDARNAAAAAFREEFPELAGDALLADLVSPIERFTKELPGTLLINGDEKPADLLQRYKAFNDDANGPQVALVQSAKNKGWSGHDTTGKHQRVLFNLGLPTQPTMSIQQEGRIYRTGQVTDAMFRYLNTGTTWERWAFAQTIASRASAAENLASGELARALKDAYIAGFEESGDFRAGHEGEGKGGKERDRAATEAISEFDRAKAFYWGTQKKTSKTKAQEGTDYFATPEPVGLKMVQLADVRGGEAALEPSAGHGAIARWFGETVNRTAIEPSNVLGSRLAMVFDGKIVRGTFEDHNVVNKYDAVVMNPPFGSGGRTAVDHVAKAATHLRDGGRIVALIPTGPAADKKFDAWFYEEQDRPVKPLYTHPTLGAVYRGDKIKTSLSWLPEATVQGFSQDALSVKIQNQTGATSVNPQWLSSIEPAGSRTRKVRAAEGLNLIADIKLPSSAFERAGTQVMTRIVVIEKPAEGMASPQQIQRDYTGAEDINELFDRIEDLSIAPRAAAVDVADAVAQPAEPEALTPAAVAAAAVSGKAEKRAAQAAGAAQAQATGVTVVEHVTGKGKTLRGVVRTDLTKDQAKEVDAFTFKKDGGWYIRLEHLAKLNEKFPAPGAVLDMSGTQLASVGPTAPASEADQKEVAIASTRLALRMKDPSLVLTAVAPRDDRQREAAAFVKAVSGRQVIFFKSSKPSFANGFAHPDQPNILFVNVDTARPIMGLLGHELTHDMRRTEPALYDALVKAIEPLLSNESIHASRLRESYAARGIDIADDRVREELIADIVGDNWTDPAFWREVSKGRPPLFQRVLRAIRDFLDGVISKVRNERPFRSEAYLTDMVAARKAVADVMAEFFTTPERQAAARGTFDPADVDIRMDLAATPAQQERRRSDWRDATNRVQFAPGQWLYDAIGRYASPLLTKLGMKAMTPQLSRLMREMKLEVQKAQETAAAVAAEAGNFTDDERRMVSDIIEQELAAGVTPPAHALRLAAAMQQSLRAQTTELVSLGMLSEDAAARWDGKYLPRYYESKLRKTVADAWGDAAKRLLGRTSVMRGIKGKHLKGRGLWETIPADQLGSWQQLGWEMRDPDYKPGDDEVQVWRDYTRKEREDMGEIRDAGFRFVMGYMQTQRDLALGRMFAGMAADPAQSSRLEKVGWVKVPTSVVEGTGVKRYGKLAGRYVPEETMSHLSQIEEASSAAWQMYRKGMSLWKEGKTVLNPVSHVNNIVSNLTMAHLAGIGYHRGDKYVAAIKDFVGGSKMLTEANGAGLFLGTMSDAELLNTLPKELKELAQKADSKTTQNARWVYNAMTFFLRKPMGVAYQAEDTFFRYLIYKDARARGTEPADAVDYAQKFIFTYDDLPRGARFVRDFGIPFFAYTYKAVPALLHTALTHPFRMAGPAALLWTANAAAYAIAVGDDDDDWWERLQKYLNDPEYRQRARDLEEVEREDLPPWMKGTTSMLSPKAIRLGMDELTKLPVFLDVARFIPGGDIFDVSPNAGGLPLPQPITPSHPLFTTATAMLANKDLFLGKDIVDLNDDGFEKTAKRSAWLWRQMSPAIAAGNTHWMRGMNALAQASGGEITWVPEGAKEVLPDNFLGVDSTGISKTGLPTQPGYAAMQTFGIKASPIDLEKSHDINEGQQKKIIRDIDTELRRLQRLNKIGAVSESTFEREREKLREKKRELRELAAEKR